MNSENLIKDHRTDREKLQPLIEELRKKLDEKRKALQRIVGYSAETTKTSSDERKRLMKVAIENCKNPTALKWLRENSESAAFFKLPDMFHFLKKHIDEEEKKNHGDRVDITFVAHGAIRDRLIPACCLLPLHAVSDVVLYSPWNCTLNADAAFGIAAGLIKPHHRIFYCNTSGGCQIPDEKDRPSKLPDHWNSMKRAGDEKIPNITLSPVKPLQDSFWKKFESLTNKYGPPARNRIVIPFILPTESDCSQSVPLFVVCLAFALVLRTCRFQATVHLAACLGDQSEGQRFDKEHLQTQYACAADNTVMMSSADMFSSD